MLKPYFVMLRNQNGDRLVPLLDESGELCQFDTRAESIKAAMSSTFGAAFGFVVFDVDHDGESL